MSNGRGDGAGSSPRLHWILGGGPRTAPSTSYNVHNGVTVVLVTSGNPSFEVGARARLLSLFHELKDRLTADKTPKKPKKQ